MVVKCQSCISPEWLQSVLALLISPHKCFSCFAIKIILLWKPFRITQTIKTLQITQLFHFLEIKTCSWLQWQWHKNSVFSSHKIHIIIPLCVLSFSVFILFCLYSGMFLFTFYLCCFFFIILLVCEVPFNALFLAFCHSIVYEFVLLCLSLF